MTLIFLSRGLGARGSSLLGQEEVVDIGHHTSISYRHVSKELAQFLIISDSELDVPGDDSRLLVVSGSIAG